MPSTPREARPGSCENAQLSPHRFLQSFSRLLSSCFLLFHDRTSLEGGRRKKHKAHDSFYAVYPRKPMWLQKEGRGASPQGTVSTRPGRGSSLRAALCSGPSVPPVVKAAPHVCSSSSQPPQRTGPSHVSPHRQGARLPPAAPTSQRRRLQQGAHPLSPTSGSERLPPLPAPIRNGNRFCGVFLEFVSFSLLWNVPPACLVRT